MARNIHLKYVFIQRKQLQRKEKERVMNLPYSDLFPQLDIKSKLILGG